MSDPRFSPVPVNKGSCIDLDLTYQDENGDAVDVTDYEFSVAEDKPAGVFAGNAALTKTDPANGVVHLHLEAEDGFPDDALLGLRPGNVNWVRIARTDGEGCVSTSELIWIKVQ